MPVPKPEWAYAMPDGRNVHVELGIARAGAGRYALLGVTLDDAVVAFALPDTPEYMETTDD